MCQYNDGDNPIEIKNYDAVCRKENYWKRGVVTYYDEGRLRGVREDLEISSVLNMPIL